MLYLTTYQQGCDLLLPLFFAVDLLWKPPSPVSKFDQNANSKRAKPIPSLGNCPKAKAVSGLPTFIMILAVVFFVGLKRDVWHVPPVFARRNQPKPHVIRLNKKQNPPKHIESMKLVSYLPTNLPSTSWNKNSTLHARYIHKYTLHVPWNLMAGKWFQHWGSLDFDKNWSQAASNPLPEAHPSPARFSWGQSRPEASQVFSTFEKLVDDKKSPQLPKIMGESKVVKWTCWSCFLIAWERNWDNEMHNYAIFFSDIHIAFQYIFATSAEHLNEWVNKIYSMPFTSAIFRSLSVKVDEMQLTLWGRKWCWYGKSNSKIIYTVSLQWRCTNTWCLSSSGLGVVGRPRFSNFNSPL